MSNAIESVKKVQSVLSSPEAQVILQIFHARAVGIAAQIVDAFVAVETSTHPTATAEQITVNVVGDVWHYCRVKLGEAGFLVDIFANVDAFAGPVRDLVAAEVAKYDQVQAPATQGQGGEQAQAS